MEHLSNEEKARVLSIKGSCGAYVTAQGEQLLSTTETKERISIYGACMEAMQWKDEQFAEQKKALINKACKWLKEQESWDYYNDAPCKLLTKDKIVEFRKTMEE